MNGNEIWTAAEARAHDGWAVAHGVEAAWLMEVAGAKAAADFEQWAPSGPVAVVVGTGQNGGDGLVMARNLAPRRPVRVVLLRGVPTFPHAERLVRAAQAWGARVDGEDGLDAALEEARVLVDAILGTGLKGAPRDWAAGAIERMMAAQKPVYALDIPSGLDADTGQAAGPVIAAARTVTFGAVKWGHWCYPGAGLCGALVVADIGLGGDPSGARWVDPATAAAWVKPLDPGGHKYRRGRVAVVGGAPGMPGAPVMAAEAALRAGAGVVELFVPSGLLSRVRPDWSLLVHGTGESPSGGLALTDADLTRLANADAIVFGPGLGPDVEPANLSKILALAKPTLIDADGLRLIPHLGAQLGPEVVWTPHEGEMARLLGQTSGAVAAARREAFQSGLDRFAGCLVLKGPHTISGTSAQKWVNTSGVAELATAGSGDVLSGIIAGLMAQGYGIPEAAALGVYLHGWAGFFAAEALGRTMSATDVSAHLADAYRAVQTGKRPPGLPATG